MSARPGLMRWPRALDRITQSSRRARAMASTASATPTLPKPLALGTEFRGESGRQYRLTEIFEGTSTVYLARDPDGGKHVVKSSTANRFENTKKLQQPLADSTYLRAIRDSSAEHSLFVYDYLTNNVLRAVHRLGTALPHAARKRILRDTLRGIAELHSRGIFHGDIKPNNILLDIKEASAGSAEAEVGSGKLGDLESALALPPRTWIVCSHRIGNYMWCSPEAHLCEKINTPTDIFSFAITCIYVMLDMVVFAVPESIENDADARSAYALEKQFSYFADIEGVTGLATFIGDTSPHMQTIRSIELSLSREDNPSLPFTNWMLEPEGIQGREFQDVVCKMAKIGPRQRITAAEALEHPWFRDVE